MLTVGKWMCLSKLHGIADMRGPIVSARMREDLNIIMDGEVSYSQSDERGKRIQEQ